MSAATTTPAAAAAQDAALLRAVAAVQAGDTARFEQIYRACFPGVHGVVRSMLRDPGEVEDTVQEAFLSALRALPRYRPLAGVPFLAWMLRIARNAALMRLRGAGRVAVTEPAALSLRLGGTEDPRLAALHHGVATAELDRLAPRQRQVLLLRFVLDLDAAATGIVLGLTPEAVRQLQRRALATLRRRVEDATAGAPPDERLRANNAEIVTHDGLRALDEPRALAS
jgi:RNA polymerase sigma-70 factor (ECF subfamily)